MTLNDTHSVAEDPGWIRRRETCCLVVTLPGYTRDRLTTRVPEGL